jgi:hypothetical protein
MFTVLNNGTWTEKRLNSRSHGEGRIEGPVIACLILVRQSSASLPGVGHGTVVQFVIRS